MMASGIMMKAMKNGAVSASDSAMVRFCACSARARIARREEPAHLRQQHGARRYANDAERQLIDAVGVVDRGHAAGRQHRTDDGVGEKRDLGAGRADHRRTQGHKETLDVFRHRRAREALENSGAVGGRRGQRELQHAGHRQVPNSPPSLALGNRKARPRKTIIDRFITTGVKAAAAKWPCAFKVPDCSVTSVTNKR